MNENFGPVKAGANAEIYIRVTNNSETKVEGEGAEVTVTCKAATELKVNESVSITESGYSYLTFKAAEDGFYNFSCTNGYVRYYGENAWQGNVFYSAPYLIRKDAVVYLEVYSSGNNEITVTKTGNATVLAHVDVRSGRYQWITFQAPENGTYTFRSTNNTGDPKAWFFRNQDVGDKANTGTLDNVSITDGYGYDDEAGGNNNFMKDIELQAGETIYIAVGHWTLSNAISCDVYVTH